MKTIKVNASKRYDIIVTNGYQSFSEKVLNLITGERVAIITDSNVEKLYFSNLSKK